MKASYFGYGRTTMKMTGAQALIECFIRKGVEVVFGYPGGAVLPIYDVLYDAPIRHVLTRHEQGAVHAADGYARVTGKPGVCIATSGPGATNLVTGLANAYMDSIPIVAVTGQVATNLIGRDSFQEADITGITTPITKHNYLVKDVRDLPRIISEAFYIATTGRPGPVLIDLPRDVSSAEFDFVYTDKVDLVGYKPTYKGHVKQIEEAAAAINGSRRPVLYVGGGVISSGAHRELFALATKANVPVTTTLMGLGAFPGNHPLSLGMLGMHGTAYANYAVMNSDLLIAVGARFDDRVTGKLDVFAPQAKVVHIDIDPAEIGKNVDVDIPIVGDARNVLSSLVERVQHVERTEWFEKIAGWKRDYPLAYEERDDEIAPQYVVEQIYEITKGQAIIATEVGQHQMWAAQYYRFDEPRCFVSSGGLGTMGYGFPAAIGAQVGRPDRTVIDIAGDGSFQMNIQELGTVASNRIPVKVVILNNGCLGMVRQWQQLFYKERYSYIDLRDNPDFVQIAAAYGIKGRRITKREEVRPVLEEMLALPEPVVIDVQVCRGANVYPMVPAGGALDKMLGLGRE